LTSRGYPAAGERGDRRAVLGLGLWPLPTAVWAPLGVLSLLIAGHLLYGAIVNDMAMALEIGVCVLLGAALIDRRLRTELSRLRGLGLPAGLFALALVVALWSLTPWTPGGPHPVWAFVGVHPGASTIDKSSTIAEIVKLLGLACFFAMGLVSGAEDRRARFTIRLTIWAGVAFGIWALGAMIASGFNLATERLEANFLSPNTAGLWFGMLTLLALAEMAGVWRRARSGDRVEALPLAGAAFVLVVCLISTASRGSITGTLAAIAAYALMQVWTGRLKARGGAVLIGAGLVLAVILVAFAGGALIERLNHPAQNEFGRLEVWRPHWRAFLDAPVFGYGLGAEKTVNRTLLNASTFGPLWSVNAVHNLYLQWLEDAGLVGAAPMFGALGAVLVATLRGYERRSRMTGLLAGLLAADLLVLLQGITDMGVELYSMAAFWAWLLGLQFALAQGSSQR
jgi:O-antigen ligase